MTVSRVTSVFLIVALTAQLGAGCSHAPQNDGVEASGIDRVRYSELRYLAASRLECPSNRLSYQYEGEKVHVMQGCGGTVRYLIFSIDNVWVKVESFHERAKFKLKCSIKKLSTRQVGDSTWRVSGCGRTTYYALLCPGGKTECLWENVSEYEIVPHAS